MFPGLGPGSLHHRPASGRRRRLHSLSRRGSVGSMYPGAHAAASPDKPAVIMAGSGETITY
ncbi:MAG: hypothetical protein F4Z34_08325, partial [Acidimicrobiaceae bacterium]|nr:hypothetical protein [Acidimicrobiaceae bacterium]